MIKGDIWLFHFVISTHEHVCRSSYADKESCSARTRTALPTGQVNPSHAAPSCNAVPVALVGSQHQARHCPALKIKSKKPSFHLYNNQQFDSQAKWSVLKKTQSSKWFPKLLFCLLSTCAKLCHGGNLATQSKQHQVISSRLLPCACRTCQCNVLLHIIRPCWWFSCISKSIQLSFIQTLWATVANLLPTKFHQICTCSSNRKLRLAGIEHINKYSKKDLLDSIYSNNVKPNKIDYHFACIRIMYCIEYGKRYIYIFLYVTTYFKINFDISMLS